jgi:hypothetical protein
MGWLVITVSAIMVSGALIGFIWNNYTITQSGDIHINGQTEEPVSLYFDDQQLAGTSLALTTMDFTTLNPGDHLIAVHHFDNLDGHAFDVTLDLSGMPLEYADEQDVWYGLGIHAYAHGTTTPLTTFSVEPLTAYTFDIAYDVDLNFADPGALVDFPYSLSMSIVLNDLPDFMAYDDSVTFTGADLNFYPLVNDINPNNGVIISVTQPINPSMHIYIKNSGSYLQIVGSPGTTTATYTIQDPITMVTSTATIFIN